MTNDPNPARSGGTGWIGIIAALAAAAVLFGMSDGGNVEIFGLELPVVIVGLVLWFLGFLAGIFNRRRQG